MNTLWKGQRLPVHLDPSDHDWRPIRKGYPQKICRCGQLRVAGMRVGDKSLTIGPGGVDKLQWSATASPTFMGNLGMNFPLGRPSANVQQTGPQGLVNRFEDLGDRKLALLRHDNGAASLDIFGTGAITFNGSVVVNPVLNQGEFVTYSSAAAVNSDGGFNFPMGSQFITQNPYWMAMVRTGAAITGIRIWIGMFSGDPMASDTLSPNSIGFRFSTSAGDSSWAIMQRGAVSTDSSIIGAAVAANTTYYLGLYRDTTSAQFFFVLVTGGVRSVIALGPNVPAPAGGVLAVIQARNLLGVAVSLNISQLTLGSAPGTLF